MTTITVTIGRNVGKKPMSFDDWQDFRWEVNELVAGVSDEVYVRGANGVGKWNDIYEDNATWVASVAPGFGVLRTLRNGLAALAKTYKQDAIALTIGETELVEGK